MAAIVRQGLTGFAHAVEVIEINRTCTGPALPQSFASEKIRRLNNGRSTMQRGSSGQMSCKTLRSQVSADTAGLVQDSVCLLASQETRYDAHPGLPPDSSCQPLNEPKWRDHRGVMMYHSMDLTKFSSSCYGGGPPRDGHT